MKTADRYPAFADGFIVIDDRDAPSLRHAIGARIYRRRTAALAMQERSRRGLNPEIQPHIMVVPVDGSNGVFVLDYIDADGVTVGLAAGTIRLE